MSLVDGTSALAQTSEVANTLKVVSETTQNTAEIYSISQYLTETQASQPQAALAAWKYVESLGTYVPQIVTGLTATATGAYTAVAGGLAYVLSVPAAFCAVAGALGIGVGVGMYQLNPEFWTGLSNALVDAGCMVGSGVLSIVKDGKNYIPQTTIEVIKDYLISSGAYNDPTPEVVTPTELLVDLTTYFDLPIVFGETFYYHVLSGSSRPYISYKTVYDNYIIALIQSVEGSYTFNLYSVASEYSKLTIASGYGTTGYVTPTDNFTPSNYQSYTYDGKTAFIGLITGVVGSLDNYSFESPTNILSNHTTRYNNDVLKTLAWNILYNSQEAGGVEGLEKESGATYPDETKTIPEEYPNWANDGMTFLRPKTREIGENPRLNPDDVEEFVALPVEVPTISGNPANEGLEEGQQVEQGGVIDAPPVVGPLPPEWKRVIVGTDDIIDVYPPKPPIEDEPPILDVPENTDPPIEDPPVDPPIDDGGVNPPVVPPISTLGTGMNNVYNPTKAQMQEFNAFLWSNDFIDNIKKILNDPMEAVIALQMVYCTPATESGHTIVVGSLDTEISSDIVTSQYATIDCGSVTIPEYFRDYTDYSPYTQVLCFLPFIGFVNLETDDIIGSTVNIKYTVDLYTGTCLAEITVTRNNMSAILYSFNGNCAVQIPLTSGTHNSIFGVLSGLSTVGLGLGTGNPLMVLSGLATAGVSFNKNDVSRSGNLGSNAGAMGVKTPYIIVRRPVAYNAQQYNEYIGIPSNVTVKLGTLSGYTRIKETHVELIEKATDAEKDMIYRLLKDGVIF